MLEIFIEEKEKIVSMIKECGLEVGGKYSQRGQVSGPNRCIQFKKSSNSGATGMYIGPEQLGLPL